MKKKPKSKYPRIVIERVGFRPDGRIDFLDLHDEKFGEAVFFGEGNRHYHGFFNEGKYDENKLC